MLVVRLWMGKALAENFWQGETCEYCGGEIVEKHVTMHRKVKGNYVLLENIPAGLCTRMASAIFLLTFSRPLRKTCVDGGKPAARWLCRSTPGRDSAIEVPMQIK
jgi:YgiT-type zinc finger domain-containing protein